MTCRTVSEDFCRLAARDFQPVVLYDQREKRDLTSGWLVKAHVLVESSDASYASPYRSERLPLFVWCRVVS